MLWCKGLVWYGYSILVFFFFVHQATIEWGANTQDQWNASQSNWGVEEQGCWDMLITGKPSNTLDCQVLPLSSVFSCDYHRWWPRESCLLNIEGRYFLVGSWW